jgi:hypothetical protein
VAVAAEEGRYLCHDLDRSIQDIAQQHGVRATRYTIEADGTEFAEIAVLVRDSGVQPHLQQSFPRASEAAVQNWREQTASDFVFACKASKFITHWKRLSENSDNSLALIERRLALLGDKAGPILFQLPPQFAVNADRLASFFELLSKIAALQLRIPPPAGTRRASCACWPTRTSPCVRRTIMMRQRRGTAWLTSSMCAVTVPAAATRPLSHSDA